MLMETRKVKVVGWLGGECHRIRGVVYWVKTIPLFLCENKWNFCPAMMLYYRLMSN